MEVQTKTKNNKKSLKNYLLGFFEIDTSNFQEVFLAIHTKLSRNKL